MKTINPWTKINAQTWARGNWSILQVTNIRGKQTYHIRFRDGQYRFAGNSLVEAMTMVQVLSQIQPEDA
jgi:hypothetical protein